MTDMMSLSCRMLTILLFGLMAGFFYAFSVCVMPGLNNLSSEGSISAMQEINRAVRNPVFFITFFLTPVAALFMATLDYRNSQLRPALMMGLAASIYCIGVIIPTATVNVPMNEALALIPAQDASQQIWDAYTTQWDRWNIYRTLAASISTVFSSLSLYQPFDR